MKKGKEVEAKKEAKVEEIIPIAYELATKQKEISIAEFFTKNRHLLGFDNKRKALLMAIKEAVDNSLDACEEAKILPEVIVEIVDMGNDRYKVTVEDNGPGIVKEQIPKIFAKLLYGSKFHRLKMSRGQQGIGISAAVLYSQLTTGRPSKITSRISPKDPAHYYELHIDTQRNQPEIIVEKEVAWKKEHGTKIEIDLEASYSKGPQSVDEYLKQTAIVNPHVTIIYTNSKAEQVIFPRVTQNLPPEVKEIKPHPYGIELGMLIGMLKLTTSRTLQQFLVNDFSRVGQGTAKDICEKASLLPNMAPKDVNRDQAEKVLKSIQATKIISPPTDCVSPIGEELLEKGLKKEIKAEFYCSTSRQPDVYRGNPFIIEAAIAYGGEINKEGSATIMRFANRVPLLYQQGACSITESIIDTNWRSYGIQQSSNSLPYGPIVIAVHMGSVWVPFTSEAKEALAHYPEIMKEIKLAIQDCGRKLSSYVRKKYKIMDESKKRDYIQMYIPHVAEALKDILGLKPADEKEIEKDLKELIEKKRGKLDEIEDENIDYDAEFAAIGKEDEDGKESDDDK